MPARLAACIVCAAPLVHPPHRGRPRRFCSRAHLTADYRARVRLRAAQPDGDDVATGRPLGPLPDPDGVVALARAVYVQAWREHEQAWLADHAAQGLWRAILRAATVEGVD